MEQAFFQGLKKNVDIFFNLDQIGIQNSANGMTYTFLEFTTAISIFL